MQLSIVSIVWFIVYLIVVVGIFLLLDLLIRTVITKEPYQFWLRVVLKVLAILFAINILLGFIGVHIIRFT